MTPTPNRIGLNHDGRYKLNTELMRMLRAFGRPATIAELFDGSLPLWAQDAAARLLAIGYVTELPDGRLEPVERAAGAG